METSAQHFSSRPNGYFHVESNNRSLIDCVPHSKLFGFESEDKRNKLAEDLMIAASVPILRVAHSSISQYDIHLGDTHFRGHTHTDCTHFCSNSALFHHWTEILFNSLQFVLLKHIHIPELEKSSAVSTVTIASVAEAEPFGSHGHGTHSFEDLEFSKNVQNVTSKILTSYINPHNESTSLSGVMLTVGKDAMVFKISIKSALKNLVDINRFYVITPDPIKLKESMGDFQSSRVIFVDESVFPFNKDTVCDVMLQTVREIGKYPLDKGKSIFENILWQRAGWFLQQLLKLYAGIVLKLEDFVLLDSDIVWYKEVRFINKTSSSYFYAYSSQYHPSYRSSMRLILGLDHTPGQYYSGICHHMVIKKDVLSALSKRAELLHGGLPLWQVYLKLCSIFFFYEVLNVTTIIFVSNYL